MRLDRKVLLGPADVLVERRPGGIVHLRSPHALAAHPKKITEQLDLWAAKAPGRLFLAQRDKNGGWRPLTYGEARERARPVGHFPLSRNLFPEPPPPGLPPNHIPPPPPPPPPLHLAPPYPPIPPPYS